VGGTTATATFRKDNIIDIVAEVLHPQFFEFPRINYKYNGKMYNYVYGASSRDYKPESMSIPEPDTVILLILIM
jgi:carotenoid cleavage dioxygenase-like enzyme